MAFGLDIESIIAKLGENPAVLQVINQVKEVCNGVVVAMAHFNSRLDALEAKQDANSVKLELIYQTVAFPSDISPAADDGLMKLLSEGGEEMKIQEVEPLPESNNDGSKKSTIN